MESSQALEQALRDLPRIGRLVKDRPYRQVWRFAFGGKAYYLKFYPRGGLAQRLRRMFRGSPAMREFSRLQWLQKAGIPAPRAVAVLMGYRIEQRLGDALILEAIEPSVQLDEYLVGREPTGLSGREHRDIERQVRQIVHGLGAAGLGHSDLHLGNLLLRSDEGKTAGKTVGEYTHPTENGKVYLLDGYAVRRGGLRMRDLEMLAHSARRWCTTTDLRRSWRALQPGTGGRWSEPSSAAAAGAREVPNAGETLRFTTSGTPPMPPRNTVSRKLWRHFVRRVFRQDRYFGRLSIGPWRGHFGKQYKLPHHWSVASQMPLTKTDWESAWPALKAQLDSDQLTVIKRSASGDVLSGEVTLGGRKVPIVVKRPKRRYWHRHISEIGRGCRARRAWKKAWQLVVRNIPTGWPMLVMEKRRMGIVVDQLIIFERVPGRQLALTDLAAMPVGQRPMLLRRVGRLMRRIEQSGLYLYDSKANNWIVRDDGHCGPWPVVVDVDGLRPVKVPGGGLKRLLKSVRAHPQFCADDESALLAGYRGWETGG